MMQSRRYGTLIISITQEGQNESILRSPDEKNYSKPTFHFEISFPRGISTSVMHRIKGLTHRIVICAHHVAQFVKQSYLLPIKYGSSIKYGWSIDLQFDVNDWSVVLTRSVGTCNTYVHSPSRKKKVFSIYIARHPNYIFRPRWLPAYFWWEYYVMIFLMSISVEATEILYCLKF